MITTSMKKGLSILFTLFALYVSGQTFERTELSVTINESSISNPWTGGLNSCLFSELDFNLDGTKDLLVFDKSANKVLPFINNGSSYSYSHSIASSIPIENNTPFPWMLALDYNCDNRNDLFVFNGVGLSVYKNISEDNLAFELVTDFLSYDNEGNTLSLFILDNTLPYLGDFDNDGDIDLMSFPSSGLATIHYYKNNSMENNGSCGLALSLADDCWGNFSEAGGNYSLQSCVTAEAQALNTSAADGAYTMQFIDIDVDTDKDLILGHDIINNINLLYNDGADEINDVSIGFPLNTIAASLNKLPATFHLDVNHDNLKDLVISPFLKISAENFESNWLYTNSGTEANPIFELQQQNFLQDQTIDLGEGAYPAALDYNNDGLIDLLVGNHGYYESNGNYTTGLALFENTGSNKLPAFKLIDRDFGGLSTIPLNTVLDQATNGLTPTLGDLDGDNDLDLIVGDVNGKIHYFKNTASSGTVFEIENANFFNIDVGNRAAPQLIDLNEDGLLDLIIGERDGTLNYIANTGTVSEPVFNDLTPNFGGVNTASESGLVGNSTPYCYKKDGVFKLMVGSEDGLLHQYTNISGNLNGAFTSNGTLNLREGNRCAPLHVDLNNDGNRDLVIGNIAGGLAYYEGDDSDVSISTQDQRNSLQVYPNPTEGKLRIQSTNQLKWHYRIFDLRGKLLESSTFRKDKTLDLSFLRKGMYVLELQNEFGISDYQKIIKK